MSKKNHTPKRILAVVTSTPEYEKAGYRTGLWLGELTHFYDVATEAGHEVVIASIAGGRVPIDPESLGTVMLKLGGTDKRYADRAFMDLLQDTPSVESLAGEAFDAVYLTGGHGTMFDFPSSTALAERVTRTAKEGGVVAAVCHGPAGLLSALGPDGEPLLKGRKATGFSWREEKLAGRDDAVPFRLDELMKEQGAKYTKALAPMSSKVVVDGTLVTGQNPTSAKGVGEAVVKLLGKKRPS